MNRRAFFASLLVPFAPKPAKPDHLELYINLRTARQAFQQAMEAAVIEAVGPSNPIPNSPHLSPLESLPRSPFRRP